MRLTLLALAATALSAVPAVAQFPPAKLTNLKYYSRKIPVRSLTDSMRYFTRALGVRCEYCHVPKDPNDLAAYNFGEVPLTDAAETLRGQGKAADAMRLYVLNTTLLPASGFAHRQAAGGYLALGDTASAIAMYEKAMAINANDRQAQQALATLRAKR